MIPVSNNTRRLTKQIRVSVVAADGLIKRDFFRSPNPFAVISINREQSHTTAITNKKTTNPYWNEEFTFTIDESSEITIRIFDYRGSGRTDHNPLGKAVIRPGECTDLNIHGDARLTLKLESEDDRTVQGKITVHIFATTSDEHFEDALGPLPPGWERRRDHLSRWYYLDHNTRTTTWKRPPRTSGDLRESDSTATIYPTLPSPIASLEALASSASEDRRAPIASNKDTSRAVGSSLPKYEATRPISRVMPIAEIITYLGDHGCEDVTEYLDFALSGEFPVSSGGFGDIYKGKLLDGTNVAIKTMRMSINSTSESAKHLKDAARELHTWSKCSHPNVLKLLGLVRYRGQIGMASPWAELGSLPGYISQYPHADRCWISTQICAGLSYLHTCGIIHGDLKGPNILVSSNGTPMLTDFGNAILKDCTLQFTDTTMRSSLSPRWAAPELLEGSSTYSKEADVYALAMTILETITGNVPFFGKVDHAVWFAVGVKQEIPTQPEKYIPHESKQGDALWALLVSCWLREPKERPNAEKVENIMGGITSDGLLLSIIHPPSP